MRLTKNITTSVKLDILKLKNVSELDEQMKQINQMYKDEILAKYGRPMTLEDIPLDDSKTWKAFQEANTQGVFQFTNGHVSGPALKKIKPTNLEELSAVTAFIRPGASGIDEYVAAKNDIRCLRKIHPKIDRHLTATYGAVVYQEQIMFLISELMGIDFGEADIYRRALEKSKKPQNKKHVDYFNENAVRLAVENGINKEAAEITLNLIMENIGYGFNKAHAICYSLISYRVCWMKENYPLIFHKTMLNSNIDELGSFIDLATDDGVNVLPPHINFSHFKSDIEDSINKKIRIGFNAIKGVGDKAAESIIANAPYNSINEFFEKNNSKALNKKVVEVLIGSGALDGMGIEIDNDDIPEQHRNLFHIENGLVYLNRKQLELWYEKYIEVSHAKTSANYLVPAIIIKQKFFEEFDLQEDDDGNVVIPEVFLDEMGLDIKELELEKTRKHPKGLLKEKLADPMKKVSPLKKVMILYFGEIAAVKQNSLQVYLEECANNGVAFMPHPLMKYKSKLVAFKDVEDGNYMMTAGIVTELIKRTSAKGTEYYWVTIKTPMDTVRVTIWSNQYNKFRNIIQFNSLIAVKGKKGYGGISAEDIKQLTV